MSFGGANDQDLKEIISGLSASHIDTLKRAGDISPFIKGRTIGADIDTASWTTHKPDFHEKSTRPQADEPRKYGKIRSPKMQIEQIADLPRRGLPDYEAIKSKIALRNEEKKQQIAIQTEMLEHKKAYLEMINKINKERESSMAASRQLRLQQQREKERIINEKSTEKALALERELQQELSALNQQRENALLTAALVGVQQRQKRFYENYDEILKLLYAFGPKSSEAAEYSARVKEALQGFDRIIKKAKSGECGAEELNAAELSCAALAALELDLRKAILKNTQDVIAKQKQQELYEKQQQQERQQRQEQQQQEEQHQQQLQQQQQQIQQQQQQHQDANKVEANNEAVPLATGTALQSQQQQQQGEVKSEIDGTDKTDSQGFQELVQKYREVLSFYQERVDRVKPLQADENFKKFRFACKKAITIPINTIASTPQHLQDKFERLYGFLCGQPTNDMVRITDHPLGRDYSLLLMAKQFVTQGETEISSNPNAAFPVASMVVTFWKIIPEFGQLFLAYLYKASTFMVPYYAGRKGGQSLEESLGYELVDGRMESTELYLKRQSGVVRLYAAVMVTYGRQADGPSHPHAVNNAWSFLANIMKIRPVEHISATVIFQLLHTVAESLYIAYGKQFLKLLFYMQNVYMPTLAAIDNGGPRSRLETLLNSILKDRQIAKPQGMLPPGYW